MPGTPHSSIAAAAYFRRGGTAPRFVPADQQAQRARPPWSALDDTRDAPPTPSAGVLLRPDVLVGPPCRLHPPRSRAVRDTLAHPTQAMQVDLQGGESERLGPPL